MNTRTLPIIGLSLVVLMATLPVLAQELPDAIRQSTAPFRQYSDLTLPTISVPTVVEFALPQALDGYTNVAVLDRTLNTFQPSLFQQQSQAPTTSAVTATSMGIDAAPMVDTDSNTFTEFAVPDVEQGRATIELNYNQNITSSALSIGLDNFVSLPTSIDLRIIDGNNVGKIVVAKTAINQAIIRFPKTTAKKWIITFTYGQPLRITDLRLIQENAPATPARMLRFLAQPTHTYRLYADSDRPAHISVPESGNLGISEGVKKATASALQLNPDYIIADTDGDTIPDIHDNCVHTPNTDQADIDANGRGDVCDDFDTDGILNSRDNCPSLPNGGQADIDGDGIGDVCDTEESRITEREGWLPWAGMGLAAAVLITLVTVTLKRKQGEIIPEQVQVPQPEQAEAPEPEEKQV